MSSRLQKSFVVAAFVSTLISADTSAAREAPHNLILIIPEALPAAGIDQSKAPALARLRHEGVSFSNSHAGFPRLTPADSVVDASDLEVESLLAAASERYSALLVTDRDASVLERLITPSRRFFIVYQLKEPQGIDNSATVDTIRPAFKAASARGSGFKAQRRLEQRSAPLRYSRRPGE
jgi:hypothetical protein